MAYNILKVFRRDADTSAVADGASDQLSTNAFGRLKVSTWHGAFDTVTGTITTSTSTVSADISRAGSATISIAGTYAGVNMTFEAYDGVNWIAIPAQPVSLTNTQVTATGVITANSTLAWDVAPLLGFQQVRVRATAYTSGTANIRILPADGVVEYATQVNGTVSFANNSTVKSSVNTTAGGATSFTLVSAASTNATLISTAAARSLYGVQAFNNAATVAYVKIYANATAPTVGTTVPVFTFAIPPNGGFVYTAPPQGIAIAAGLGIAITGGNTTADTTAVAANQVNLNVQYA